jgi:TorA maturation chaperone TorD
MPKAALPACVEELRRLVPEGTTMRRDLDSIEEASRGIPLEKEYHRLFLGPSKPLAPPFESAYRLGTRTGAAAAEFRRELEDAGLAPADTVRFPPDHIALELEYLATLEARACGARERRDPEATLAWSTKAAAFRADHLARWLPAFLARLEEAAPRSPYTAVVRLAVRAVRARQRGR